MYSTQMCFSVFLGREIQENRTVKARQLEGQLSSCAVFFVEKEHLIDALFTFFFSDLSIW